MKDRSKVIFGNEMSSRVYHKAEKSKKKYSKKFGDDAAVNYPLYIEKNPYIGDALGVQNILINGKDNRRKYPYGVWTLQDLHGDGICGKASGLYTVLARSEFLPGDDLHQGDQRTE